MKVTILVVILATCVGVCFTFPHPKSKRVSSPIYAIYATLKIKKKLYIAFSNLLATKNNFIAVLHAMAIEGRYLVSYYSYNIMITVIINDISAMHDYGIKIEFIHMDIMHTEYCLCSCSCIAFTNKKKLTRCHRIALK